VRLPLSTICDPALIVASAWKHIFGGFLTNLWCLNLFSIFTTIFFIVKTKRNVQQIFEWYGSILTVASELLILL
ncbi:hypothetical protein ACJX0J_025735, partial [Zea mays]